MKRAANWCLLLAVVLVAGGCQRARLDTVRIGVALPIPGGTGVVQELLAGARLAVQEINDAGGVLGRQIELVTAEAPQGVTAFDASDRPVVDAGRQQAATLAAYAPLAVVGHDLPGVATAASEVYDSRKILFLTPYQVDSSLRNDRDRKTFQSGVPTRFVYEAMGRYARAQGLCRVLVFRERTAFGREQELVLHTYFQALGLSTVVDLTFDRNAKITEPLLVHALSRPDVDIRSIDAFVFIGLPSAAVRFLEEATRLKVRLPVLLPWFSTSPESLRSLSPDALNLLVAQTVFGIARPSPALMAFIRRFRQTYGTLPVRDAFMAYDAILLLARAIEQTGSVDRDTLANYLRAMRFSGPFEGLTGPLFFDEHGVRLGSRIETVRPNLAGLSAEELQQIRSGTRSVTDAIAVVESLEDTMQNPDLLRQLPPPVCRPH